MRGGRVATKNVSVGDEILNDEGEGERKWKGCMRVIK